jgi:hypothetical protein
MRNIASFASLFLLVAACGKAAPEAVAPQAPVEAAPSSLAGSTEEREQDQEPATLAEAEALLEKARADLEQLALNEAGSAQAPPGAAPAAPPPVSTRAQEKRAADKADQAAAPAAAPAPKKEANTCETACKAFSSLERASDAVCRLDTEAGGKRCERAKQIREDAARRISSCSCK